MKKQLSTEEQREVIMKIMRRKRKFPKQVIKGKFHKWSIEDDLIAYELSLKSQQPSYLEKISQERGIRITSFIAILAINEVILIPRSCEIFSR